jgi:hypothetical protein
MMWSVLGLMLGAAWLYSLLASFIAGRLKDGRVLHDRSCWRHPARGQRVEACNCPNPWLIGFLWPVLTVALIVMAPLSWAFYRELPDWKHRNGVDA